MKKVIFIISIFVSVYASAQRYTLQFGQRECTFYYWGQHWIDCCTKGSLRGKSFVDDVPSIYLRHCDTPDSLKVIGVAAACRPLGSPYLRGSVYDTVNRLPEYFQLYDAGARGPVLLAETRWDTATPRYQILYWNSTTDNTGNPLWFVDTMPIYEAFFDTPVVVTDSFYVGGTTNNDIYHYDEATRQYIPYLYQQKPTEYTALYMYDMDDQQACPMTPRDYYLCKRNPYAYRNTGDDCVNRIYSHCDTNWHYYKTVCFKYAWLCFFPIIDTAGLGFDGFQWLPGIGCDTVRTFRLLYIEGQRAYLSWSANRDALSYEVSYGPEGTTPEQGTKVQLGTSMVCLDSLEPGRRYVAYVRAHCADNAKSPWTEGVYFRMPTGNSIDDASLASRFTEVMPNPATTQATVISSFTINRIEVYTAAGQHVLTTEPKANAAALDLSTLSAGTYLLRIQTSAGDTAKKLVVQ